MADNTFRVTMGRDEARKIIALVAEAKDSGCRSDHVIDGYVGAALSLRPRTAHRYILRAAEVLKDDKRTDLEVAIASLQPVDPAAEVPAAPPEGPEEPADPVEVRRHKERAKSVTAQLQALEKRLVKAEDIRGEIMGLGAPVWTHLSPEKAGRSTGSRSIILHVSDIQYGENIDIEAMDGVNSFGIEIANKRIARYFQKANRFATELWHGEPAERIILLLNGDMISGSLHQELAQTDEARPLVAAKMVSEQLAGGISLLRQSGFPVQIICTPGNHGRMTMKPESKDHVLQNYDTLVGWFLEMIFKGDDGVSVRYSNSVDAQFSVYGFPMVATHGDRIGSRGGTGFLGATATILRGHHKLYTDYATRGVTLYKIFTGHFHTPAVTVWGYANNTMAGPSEYARDGRMMMTPASQDYFVIQDEHGIIEHRVIAVGTGDEGSSNTPVAKYMG